jgi:hypothetical protein
MRTVFDYHRPKRDSVSQKQAGMDDEAVKAASRFVFRPAMRRGRPVPVMVNIIIEFRMR